MKVFKIRDHHTIYSGEIDGIDLSRQNSPECEATAYINHHIGYQERFRKGIKAVLKRDFVYGDVDLYSTAIVELKKYQSLNTTTPNFGNIVQKLRQMAFSNEFNYTEGCKPLIITNPPLIIFPPMTVQYNNGDINERAYKDGLVTQIPYMSPTGLYMISESNLKRIGADENIVDLVVTEIRDNFANPRGKEDLYKSSYSEALSEAVEQSHLWNHGKLFEAIYCDDLPVFSDVAMQTFEDLSD